MVKGDKVIWTDSEGNKYKGIILKICKSCICIQCDDGKVRAIGL